MANRRCADCATELTSVDQLSGARYCMECSNKRKFARNTAPSLITVEDAYEKEQRRHVKTFEIGETVKVYLVGGVQRMKVNEVYDTPVEHVKLYELKTADGSYYYATKDFMSKV